MRETQTLPGHGDQSRTGRDVEGLDAPSSIRLTSAIEDGGTHDAANNLPSNEDLLAEFDVDSDDREFLAELMHMAPKSEVAMLQKARYEELDYDKPIKKFARSHPIYELAQGKVDEGALMQFRTDVYEFSRAAGMEKKKAKTDSWRAVAALINHGGLKDGLSSGEELIKSSAPKLTQAKDYYKIGVLPNQAEIKMKKKEKRKGKKKRKKQKDGGNRTGKQGGHFLSDDDTQAPVFVKSNTLQTSDLPLSGEKKRKLSSLETQVFQDRDLQGIQDNTRHGEIGPSTREDGGSQVDPTTSRATTKRLKPGPITSAYFTIPPTSLEDYEAPNTAGGLVLLAAGDTTIPASSRWDRKRNRLANSKPAERENSTGEVDVARQILPMNSIYFPLKAVGSKDAASTIKESPSEYAASHGQSADQPADQAPNTRKIPKRKRKRNKNRLNKIELESWAIKPDRQHKSPYNQQQSAQPGPHHTEKRGTTSQQGANPLTYQNGNGVTVSMVPLNAQDITGRQKDEAQDEANNVAVSSHTTTTVKRQRGDRGRSSKRRSGPDTGDSRLEVPKNPLAELGHEKSSTQNRERRDRGRGRKGTSVAIPSTEENDQQTKDCHS